MLYLLLLLLIVFCVLRFDFGKSHKSDTIIYNLILCAFICLAGFRRDLGGDTWAYMEYFDLYPTFFDDIDNIIYFISISLFDGYMPLWTLLNILAKTISSDFYVLQLFQAFIVNFLFFKIFKDISICKYLCVLIYFIYSFWYMNAEIMREAIAVAIGAFAIRSFCEQKIRKYIILVVFSVLFHPSALLLLVLLVINPAKFNLLRFIIYSLFAFLIFILSDTLMLKFLGVLDSTVPIFARVSVYFNRGASIWGYIYNYLVYFFVPGIGALIILGHRLLPKDSPLYVVINIYFAVAALLIPLISLNRLLNYFTPFAIMLLVVLIVKITNLKSISLSKITIVFIIAGVIMKCYSFYYTEYVYQKIYHRYDMYLPYTHIWEDSDVVYRRGIWTSTITDVDFNERS